MKVLTFEEIKKNLEELKDIFKITDEWENGIEYTGINRPYKIIFNFYRKDKKYFDEVHIENIGKRNNMDVDIRGRIDLGLDYIEKFEISTSSLGNITAEEGLKLIEGYKVAIDIVNKLNSAFFEK